MTAPHIPVLLDEVIEALDPQPGDVVVDATFGAGGYTRAILERFDHLVEENGNMRRGHLRLPLAASAWNRRHEALARSSCGPIA